MVRRSGAGNEILQIEEVRQRDQAIRGIKEDGLKAWKQNSDYHQRSLAETAMFRVKTALVGRGFRNQKDTVKWRRNPANRLDTRGVGQN